MLFNRWLGRRRLACVPFCLHHTVNTKGDHTHLLQRKPVKRGLVQLHLHCHAVRNDESSTTSLSNQALFFLNALIVKEMKHN